MCGHCYSGLIIVTLLISVGCMVISLNFFMVQARVRSGSGEYLQFFESIHFLASYLLKDNMPSWSSVSKSHCQSVITY